MPDTSRDPVDHSRTARKHAGEAMKNGQNAPGIIAVGLGVLSLVIGLFAFATGRGIVATVAVVLAVLLGAGGLAWLALEHRRVRKLESDWHDEHPEKPAEPPTS
ncbi:protein UsfY [Mycolicibacterium sp.]|uniref:protein UsfY n=1 Tax=Mycolicibacterium sp. TaxID=2320850 RepID=UPI003D15327A